jgi:GNAT superfamily N-acetyltransferase
MLNIRRARTQEGGRLADVAVAAKSHWGYSDEFLEGARRSLNVPEEAIDAGRVFVLEDDQGEMIGFFGFEGEPPAGVLEWMFLRPAHIGRGLGRRMWSEALERARSLGFAELLIESDRYAEAFYARMGATRVGESRSPVDGAALPVFRIEL